MIVLGISSLYPIDLTAAACALLFEPQPCQLFINDAATLPTDHSTRVHTARAALPLPRWEWDADRTWYQCHLPLEGEDHSVFSEAFFTSAKHVADLLKIGGDMPAADRCMANVRKLKEHLVAELHGLGSWSAFIGSVGCSLLEAVTGIKPYVACWSSIREGSNGRYPVNKMLHRILNPMRAGEVVKFRRGGFIELLFQDGKWTRCHGFRCAVLGRYQCLTDHGRKKEFDLGVLADDALPARCGGPLELELLADLGSLVHLPWYAGGALERTGENLGRICGQEYISPVTCVDKRRVAHRFGGDALRLTPGGYSLLDFKEGEVLTLCRGLLNIPALEWDDLIDWCDLANAYPRTDERLSKSQASARAFVAVREKENRVAQGSTADRHWPDWERVSSFPKLGNNLLTLLTIVGDLREWFNPFIGSQRVRERFPWPELLDGDHMDIARLTLPLTKVHRLCCDGLVGYGLPENELSDITAVRERGIHETRSRVWPVVRPIVSSTTGWERENGLGLLIQSLRDVCVAYYGLAGFIVGAPLKATLYWLFLLFGPAGTCRALRSLLAQREFPRLNFDLEVIEYRSTNDT